jgi:hypothetical protein
MVKVQRLFLSMIKRCRFAMQKVEGSSPFIRSIKTPLKRGFCFPAAAP